MVSPPSLTPLVSPFTTLCFPCCLMSPPETCRYKTRYSSLHVPASISEGVQREQEGSCHFISPWITNHFKVWHSGKGRWEIAPHREIGVFFMFHARDLAKPWLKAVTEPQRLEQMGSWEGHYELVIFSGLRFPTPFPDLFSCSVWNSEVQSYGEFWSHLLPTAKARFQKSQTLGVHLGM